MPLSLEPPPPLPDDVLARRNRLERKPEGLRIAGQWVVLEPTDVVRDAAALFAACNGSPMDLGHRQADAYDPEVYIFRWLPYGPFADLDAFCTYLTALVDAPDARAYTALDAASGQPVGVINAMSHAPEHLKIELGGIWYSPVVQRTKVNLEATYLLARWAFESGYRRLEWKCDALNERSRRSAARMGFRFEGVQDGHMIVKGRNRDTAWYRLLEAEWPEARQRLEDLLQA